MSYPELKNKNFEWINSSVDKNNKKSFKLHNYLGFDLIEERKTSFSFQISRRLLFAKLRLFLSMPDQINFITGRI